MDKFLGQEIPEKDRWQFLQDNADAVEEIGYTHRFTPDELAQKKESLAETSIQINDIEIEKKEAMEAFKAELKPLNERKQELLENIKKLKEDGNRVMMCGDGINDSPALTNADIGVSVKSGTDIAMDSSDVILTKNDLNSILKLIKISEKTIKNIKQNLFWAFFYNCLMIPVAIGLLKPFGISINPMIASLAMVFSSFTVILNALRLRRSFRAGR